MLRLIRKSIFVSLVLLNHKVPFRLCVCYLLAIIYGHRRAVAVFGFFCAKESITFFLFLTNCFSTNISTFLRHSPQS